jgi:hypothetical protein
VDAEQTNPYAPPKAVLTEPQPDVGRFYTPWQICVATLLGGPIAGGALVFRNHVLFGARDKAKLALGVSIAVVVAVTALGVAMPQAGRGLSGLSFVVAVVYRSYASKVFDSEITQRRDKNWTQQPWWHAIAAGVLMLAAVLGAMYVVSLLFRVGNVT